MPHQFITNQEWPLSDVINNILPNNGKLDFWVGYFYFSGFKEIYKNLSSKHGCIFVGLDVEKDIINVVRECELIKGRAVSRAQIRENYKLINEYKKIEEAQNEKSKNAAQIKAEADDIAKKIRDILSSIVINISCIGLQEKEWKEDMILQEIYFPEVKPPELATYNLGPLGKLYCQTLVGMSLDSAKGGFQGVRYNQAQYLREEYKLKYIEDFTCLKISKTIGLLEQGQANMAIFMCRLLVRKFESSMHFPRLLMDYVIQSYEKMKDYCSLYDLTAEEIKNVEN